MKLYILSIITVFIFSLCGFAQEIDLDKDDFRSKDDYKNAKDYLKDAEDYYELGVGGFARALEYYLEIHKLNPNIAALNYKIGNCYLYTFQKEKSIDYFNKAFEINRYVADDILFKIARGHHLNMAFDKAIEYYNKFKNLLSPKQLAQKKSKIEKYIAELKTILEN